LEEQQIKQFGTDFKWEIREPDNEPDDISKHIVLSYSFKLQRDSDFALTFERELTRFQLKRRIDARRGYIVSTARAVIVSTYGLQIDNPHQCREQVLRLLQDERFAMKEIREITQGVTDYY
jgi:hypothetical protein